MWALTVSDCRFLQRGWTIGPLMPLLWRNTADYFDHWKPSIVQRCPVVASWEATYVRRQLPICNCCFESQAFCAFLRISSEVHVLLIDMFRTSRACPTEHCPTEHIVALPSPGKNKTQQQCGVLKELTPQASPSQMFEWPDTILVDSTLAFP